MLVEVEHIDLWKRGLLSWMSRTPTFSAQIRGLNASSPTVTVKRGGSKKRLGLVLEVPNHTATLVICVKKEQLELPLHHGASSIMFETRKYKGKAKVAVSDGSYFLLHEIRHSITHANNGHTTQNGLGSVVFSEYREQNAQFATRRLYNGEQYVVDLERAEIVSYPPAQNIPEIAEAHAKALTGYGEKESDPVSAEEESYIRKVKRLRCAPEMFITIFSHTTLEVSRNSCVEAFYGVYRTADLRKKVRRKLSIKFTNEIGHDHGALRKEFFEITAQKLVSDERFCITSGLVDLTPAADLEVCRRSATRERAALVRISDHSFYGFVGFFLGQCVFQQVQIGVRFAPALLRALLKQKGTEEDILDEQVRQSLDWVRKNDVTGMGFMMESGIEVTNETRSDFIQEVVEAQTCSSKPGYARITSAFHAIVVPEILEFTVAELQRLLSGVEKVPLEYLMQNTIYKRCNQYTKEVAHFWELMQEGDEEFRRGVLRFITGASSVQKVPGLAKESLVIEKSHVEGALPSAHACFRRIVLGTYRNKQELKAKLQFAIEETCGFHFI